jgi:hypothetical protein
MVRAAGEGDPDEVSSGGGEGVLGGSPAFMGDPGGARAIG